MNKTSIMYLMSVSFNRVRPEMMNVPGFDVSVLKLNTMIVIQWLYFFRHLLKQGCFSNEHDQI